MITAVEEPSPGSTTVQFTVSRSSLPNLLEWSERLQARFRVAMEIQWELDREATRSSEARHVRWVVLRGDAEDCTKAKDYIIIFCDAEHKMNITYPESIHTELKESQTELEEKYSCILQFLKVGELLAKSNDEVNLSLILSIIEEKDMALRRRTLHRRMPRTEAPDENPKSGASIFDEDVEVDIMTEPSNGEPESGTNSSRSPCYSPAKQRNFSGSDPSKLEGADNAITRGQLSKLNVTASQSSISPDRKKVKSYSRLEQGRRSESPPFNYYGSTSGGNLFQLHLSSQQMLAVKRLQERGDFTKPEIDRVLDEVGSEWECSDLITKLRKQRTQKAIPSTVSRPEITSTTNLDKLKSAQELLMQNLWEQSSSKRTAPESSTGFGPISYSTPAAWTVKEERIDPYLNTNDQQLEREHVLTDDDSVITLDETDSIIIIPSESEAEIVIGDSSEESDEQFYIEGILQQKPTKASGSRLTKPSTETRQLGHVDVASAEREKQDELRGIIESLRQQITDLQDKTERDRAEASSQQQVATLLQQTQHEEMERQHLQQQRKLLQQQREFQKQFELQEQKLKAQQELGLKQLQQQQQQQQEKQQQQQQATAAAEDPAAIVIAPAKRTPFSPLRPVVIDGSNVAMSHGRGKIYSCPGIAMCIQFFQRRGHQDITVFVPQGRRTQNPNNPERPMKDQKILGQLEKQGLLSFTPSRRIGSTYVNCYDDRFIVELAVANDGVIVSNDNYRDLMGVSTTWKYVIENRLVMYTFAGDHFMIPDDPLGKRGPRIDQILRKSRAPATAAVTSGKLPLLAAAAPLGSVLITVPGQSVPVIQSAAGIVPQRGTGGVARPMVRPLNAPWTLTSASKAGVLGQAVPMGHSAAGMVPQRGTSGAAGAPVIAATSQPRPAYSTSTPASQGASKPGTTPSIGTKPAHQRGTSGTTGAQMARHGAPTSSPPPRHQPAPSTSTSASKAASKPGTAPSIGTKPAHQRGTSGTTGVQMARHGAPTSSPPPRRQPAPSTSTSASQAASKPAAAPSSVGQKAGQDPRDHPCYEVLMCIFASNKEDVLRVLARNSDKEDANELVLQVLVEKEQSEP